MQRRIALALSLLVLLLLAIVPVFAGPSEDKFGVGEADWGGSITWGSQSTTSRNAYDWRPDSSTSTRTIWQGPDVLGTYIFVHSPDTYSEGPLHFGPTYTGKVSNGASDPLVDGLDVFWITRDDRPRDGEWRAPQAYYYSSGHRYNRNGHSLRPAGTLHMHDTNNDGYVNCFDIPNFNPSDGVNTCDPVNQVNSSDGVYVEDLSRLASFIQNNAGEIWVIGGEHHLVGTFNDSDHDYTGGLHGVDPFMYAMYLWRMENWIHSQDSTARVYLGDLGNLHGKLNCSHNQSLCGDVNNEAGTDADEDDHGDWWYTVANHYNNVNNDAEGAFDGFMMDAGIPGADEIRCVNSDTGSEANCGSLSAGAWIRRTWVYDYVAQSADYPQFGLSAGGQWMERQRRPLTVDHDDSRWGGLAWNAFIRWLETDYRFPLFFLVENGSHTAIATWFTGQSVSVTTNQTWGAGGRTLFFEYPDDSVTNPCPPNPWIRYSTVSGNHNDRATRTTSGVGTNDRNAGYAACEWRPGYSGIRVYTSSNDWDNLVFVGMGKVNRIYRKDDNGNNSPDTLDGVPDSGGDYLAQVIPSTTGEREDNLMSAGLELELVMKWMKDVGFSDYNVKWTFARATHDMPDNNDGDLLGPGGICSGQEYGLVDQDGGGNRTPAGEIFYNVRGTANYMWWPSLPATWDASAGQGACYDDNAWNARPDQNTNNDGSGGTIETGDLPSGW